MTDGNGATDSTVTPDDSNIDSETDTSTSENEPVSDTSHTSGTTRQNTPGRGVRPDAEPITPDAPEEFGLVQVWWGDGKGKTTAALGMSVRAAGHGFRVHLLQFLKGGADSVEAVRGEYNAIAALPGLSYENLGHYGWVGMADGSDEAAHEAQVDAGFERARELVDCAAEADLSTPFDFDSPPEDGVHLLVLDEVLYAVSMGLLDPGDLVDLVTEAPDGLELVLTGSHEEPSYLLDHADLVTQVRKSKHPMDVGQRARRGAEY
jgi:cob(I)alamin adenosyltransferase